MAYDEDLADRAREVMSTDAEVTERKMFGGADVGSMPITTPTVRVWAFGTPGPVGMGYRWLALLSGRICASRRAGLRGRMAAGCR